MELYRIRITGFFANFAMILALLTVQGFGKSQAVSVDDLQKSAHFLSRTSFGPLPGQVESIAKSGDAGWKAWLEQQLRPDSVSDAAVDRKLKQFESLSMTNAEIFGKYS